jgi:hypothetical protein
MALLMKMNASPRLIFKRLIENGEELSIKDACPAGVWAKYWIQAVVWNCPPQYIESQPTARLTLLQQGSIFPGCLSK